MRISTTSLQLLLTALLAAALILVVSWGWQRHGDAIAEAQQTAMTDTQHRQLRANLLSLDRQIRDLRQALQEGSNTLAAVTLQYQKEQATHAPLRRQIETMMEQQVREKDQLDRRDRTMAEVQASLAQIRSERDSLSLQLTNAVRRTATLEADLKARAESIAALTTQLAESRKEAAAASAQAAASQGQATQAIQRLEANEKALADLRQALAKASADKAAAESAAAKATADKAAAEAAAARAANEKAAAEKALEKVRAEKAATPAPPPPAPPAAR